MKTIRINANLEDLKTCRMNKLIYNMRHKDTAWEMSRTEDYVFAWTGSDKDLFDMWYDWVEEVYFVHDIGMLLCLNDENYNDKPINRRNIEMALDSIYNHDIWIMGRGKRLMYNLDFDNNKIYDILDKITFGEVQN